MDAADVKEELPMREAKYWANGIDMKTLQERPEKLYPRANEIDMKMLQERLEEFNSRAHGIDMKMLQGHLEWFYSRATEIDMKMRQEHLEKFYTRANEIHMKMLQERPEEFYSRANRIDMKMLQEHLEKFYSRSGGGVVIQSVEKTELACHVGLAPVAVLANGITKSVRLILSVFKGSGTTSAPATIPKGPLFAIDIDPQWMVDSGASASLTGDRSLLQGLHTADWKGFVVANGEVVWSNSCGRAFGRVNLPGIRFAPDCNKNIISATHLVRLGCEVIFNDQGCTIRKNGTLIGKAPAHASIDGLYYLDFLNDTLLVSICPACPHPGAQGN